jgi:hypothetical protein
MTASLRSAAALAAALLPLACASGAFDLRGLEARHPALRPLDHRLGQGNPYLLPGSGALYWFECRWQLARPLRVSLPPELAERDRELLQLALASLASAGLGLRFESDAAPEDADIAVRLAEPDASKSGRTSADCAVQLRGGRVSAELVRAEVSLQRSNQGVTGKPVALSEAEWLGAAIHELGHALGFQGHVRSGPGPMVRNVEQVRAIGRRVLRGEPLATPTLRALYLLPSGALLRRDALPAGRTDAIDRLGALARERGYRGPFVRVGDRSAWIDWRDARGRLAGVWLPELARVRRDPAKLQIAPDPVAAAWLAGAAR